MSTKVYFKSWDRVSPSGDIEDVIHILDVTDETTIGDIRKWANKHTTARKLPYPAVIHISESESTQ